MRRAQVFVGKDEENGLRRELRRSKMSMIQKRVNHLHVARKHRRGTLMGPRQAHLPEISPQAVIPGALAGPVGMIQEVFKHCKPKRMGVMARMKTHAELPPLLFL